MRNMTTKSYVLGNEKKARAEDESMEGLEGRRGWGGGGWVGGGFFFSSRRRHTRLVRDWSSDVCSSDLRTGSDHDVWNLSSC